MYWLTKLAQNKTIISIVVVFTLAIILAPFTVALGEATPIKFEMDSIATSTGLGGGDVRNTVSSIINVALGLLGIVAVVIILWGGFRWMTAGGNEEKVGEARKIIFSGVIGLAIILSAFAIATFVLKQLADATGATTDYID